MLSALARLTLRPQPLRQSVQFLHVTQVNPAARKGTREKARKKKVKVEIKKVGFIPHNERKRWHSGPVVDKHIDDSWKQTPTDTVYPGRYYRWRLYSIDEAIEAHRNTNSSKMFDATNAPINIAVEMNMQGEKKTRFVANFHKMAMIQYPFDHGEDRKVLALAKTEDDLRAAQAAGAALAGGSDLVKDIHSGKVILSEYHYIVAHPNILPELVCVRGLMKRKFPNPKTDTLGNNIAGMVERFLNGINYQAHRDDNQETFGLINTSIGTLNMPTEHLKSNLMALLNDINTNRPKRPGSFITRVIMTSPPSQETLKIDPAEFPFEVKSSVRKTKDKDEVTEAEPEEDEGDEQKKAAV